MQHKIRLLRLFSTKAFYNFQCLLFWYHHNIISEFAGNWMRRHATVPMPEQAFQFIHEHNAKR